MQTIILDQPGQLRLTSTAVPEAPGPGEALVRVRAPTMLIVGDADHGVIELNRGAFERLQCEKRLEIVPRATHLFEEPGALDTVAALAGRWFRSHFRAVKT